MGNDISILLLKLLDAGITCLCSIICIHGGGNFIFFFQLVPFFGLFEHTGVAAFLNAVSQTGTFPLTIPCLPFQYGVVDFSLWCQEKIDFTQTTKRLYSNLFPSFFHLSRWNVGSELVYVHTITSWEKRWHTFGARRFTHSTLDTPVRRHY